MDHLGLQVLAGNISEYPTLVIFAMTLCMFWCMYRSLPIDVEGKINILLALPSSNYFLVSSGFTSYWSKDVKSTTQRDTYLNKNNSFIWTQHWHTVQQGREACHEEMCQKYLSTEKVDVRRTSAETFSDSDVDAMQSFEDKVQKANQHFLWESIISYTNAWKDRWVLTIVSNWFEKFSMSMPRHRITIFCQPFFFWGQRLLSQTSVDQCVEESDYLLQTCLYGWTFNMCLEHP